MPIDEMIDDPNQDEDLIPPNERRPMRLLDSRIQNDGELSDSDDEGEGGRRNHASHREGASSGHKFGAAVGGSIMDSGFSAPHAGPSVHTTAARFLSTAQMDTDTDSAPAQTEKASEPGDDNVRDAMDLDSS